MTKLNKTKMEDEDDIDILGEFTFNSCLSKNDQGIPPCSDLHQCGDSVHPQWLVDTASTTNWFDNGRANSKRSNIRPSGSTSSDDFVPHNPGVIWTEDERKILREEMSKYGRNIKKISDKLTTKTGSEIQALIEAEHGINLDSNDEIALLSAIDANIPDIAKEEVIVSDRIQTVNNNATIDFTTRPTIGNQVKKNAYIKKGVSSKNSLLKPDIVLGPSKDLVSNLEVIYEDDFMVGSTELVGDVDDSDLDTKSLIIADKNRKVSPSSKSKKIVNHRRKAERKKSKFNINLKIKTTKSNIHVTKPHVIEEKLSDVVSQPVKQLQIVTGSGQALPLCEGEQVIKITKKKDESDSESDIDIDVDSNEDLNVINKNQRLLNKSSVEKSNLASENTKTEDSKNEVKMINMDNNAVGFPVTSKDVVNAFKPEKKRQRKIKLPDGEGGYTIVHTIAGDIYQVSNEPRKEKTQRKMPIELITCKIYNNENPAPYEVRLWVSAFISMEVQAHGSRGEVMGLCGGALQPPLLLVRRYRPCRAAADRTHCDMCPVSQSKAAEALQDMGEQLVGWHHSHPRFPPSPSHTDLATQSQLQLALERNTNPFISVISSQHWATGRTASQYKCIRVETNAEGEEIGYQLSAKLHPDLTSSNVEQFLLQLEEMLQEQRDDVYAVSMADDTCPDAGVTYLRKCLSSVSHHLKSAGYPDNDPVVQRTLFGIRDIFR